MKKVVKCDCSRIEDRGMVRHRSLKFMCTKGCKQIIQPLLCKKKKYHYTFSWPWFCLSLYADLKISQKIIFRKRRYVSSNLLWTCLHWIHILSWFLDPANLVKLLGPLTYNWNCLCRQYYLISAYVRAAVVG